MDEKAAVTNKFLSTMFQVYDVSTYFALMQRCNSNQTSVLTFSQPASQFVKITFSLNYCCNAVLIKREG